MHRLFYAVALLLGLSGFSQEDQVNPEALDSFKRSIESSRQQVKAWQDSFNRSQDSLYNLAINNAGFKQNPASLLNVDVEKYERDENKLQRVYITVSIGVILFILLAVAISKRGSIFPPNH